MELIKISAMWCPSCLIMNSRVNKILKDINVELIDYDYDLDNDIVKEYNIGNTLPVIILKDNDKELLRLVGEYKENELLDKIRSLIWKR